MFDSAEGQPTRILLVSTKLSAQQDLQEALRGWQGSCEVSWVSDMRLALARARELAPHVVLADADSTEPDAISLIRDLAASIPGAAILALVAEHEIGRARQAVLAGARGFLTTPLLLEELQPTLREALAGREKALAQLARSAQSLVVFCAFKGGTGCTTLALNTAVCLHKRSKEPVVLVDAAYATPAVDVALNLHSERTIADLLPRLSHLDEDLVSGVLAAHVSGIKVLLAPPPSHRESQRVSPLQVEQVLAVLAGMFPWVIVDLGLPLNETAYAFLEGADRIMVSVIPEMVALRNSRRMLDQLVDRGYPADKMWLLLNRATLRGGVSRADIEDRLRIDKSQTYLVPDDQSLVTLSINRGVPLALSHARSDVVRATDRLAQRLIQETPEPEPVDPGTAPARRSRRSRR